MNKLTQYDKAFQIAVGIVIVFSFSVISIANAQSNSIPDPPTELDSPVSLDTEPSPIDGASFTTSRRSIGFFADTVNGDHEDAGVVTAGGGPYAGIRATVVVYSDSDLTLHLPANATRTQTLFAPTIRPPNGGCLEMGTAYTTDLAGSTHATVYVFDFCNGMKFRKQTPVNANFLANYTITKPDGSKTYDIAIVTNSNAPGLSANWNANLFNVKTKKWEIVWSSTGLHSDIRGWAIFETWYQKGQCSKSLPRIFASNIFLKNLDNSSWEEAAPKMTKLTIDTHDGKTSGSANTNCFNDDYSGPASYKFFLTNPESSWEVTSTGY